MRLIIARFRWWEHNAVQPFDGILTRCVFVARNKRGGLAINAAGDPAIRGQLLDGVGVTNGDCSPDKLENGSNRTGDSEARCLAGGTI